MTDTGQDRPSEDSQAEVHKEQAPIEPGPNGPQPVEKLKGLPRKVWISIIAGMAILILLPLALIQAQKHLSSTQDSTADTSDADAVANSVQTREPDAAGNGETEGLEINSDVPVESAPVPVDTISAQDAAIQQAKLLRIRKQGERIRKTWETLSTEQKTLSLTMAALGSDEEGKRIASSVELVDQFIALRETATPAADTSAELGEELTILLAPLEDIDAAQIQSEFRAALDDVANRIDTQLRAVQRDHRMLKAMKSVASTRAPADQDLATAIVARQEQLAESRIAEIADAAAKSRQAEIDRVTKESAEEQRKIAEAEREVERLEEQQRLDELNAIKAAKQAAIAKARLEREFQQDLPQIRSLLRPLITEGLTQPGKNGFVPADKKQPVSLAKLRGTGSLSPTAKARAGLYYIVGTMRDRDLGSFPRYTGGAQDVQSKQSTMMRVQELVNKYGELMVEKGMMAE